MLSAIVETVLLPPSSLLARFASMQHQRYGLLADEVSLSFGISTDVRIARFVCILASDRGISAWAYVTPVLGLA